MPCALCQIAAGSHGSWLSQIVVVMWHASARPSGFAESCHILLAKGQGCTGRAVVAQACRQPNF